MIYRKLGRTGERVSAIGLGGYHLGFGQDSGVAIRVIRSSIDRGINFLDNCWSYNSGESERRMGAALRDGYRDQVFLMSKFDGRTKKAAARQIDESLQRLETDHLDLIQYHENIRMEDADRFFASGGALEAVIEAKKAGKIRFIGFTGHKDPLVHLRMLEVAAERKFRFDTCQMPLNVMDAHFRSFGRHVLPKLVEQGIGVLGMKPLGDGHILQCSDVTAVQCLHYALTLPTSVVITGCETMERLDQALHAADTFRPLSNEQVNQILAKTKPFADAGRCEPFKITALYDSTARHPEWLGDDTGRTDMAPAGDRSNESVNK
jgi:predicted aldo/keto reductase-like oxidoreductase